MFPIPHGPFIRKSWAEVYCQNSVKEIKKDPNSPAWQRRLQQAGFPATEKTQALNTVKKSLKVKKPEFIAWIHTYSLTSWAVLKLLKTFQQQSVRHIRPGRGISEEVVFKIPFHPHTLYSSLTQKVTNPLAKLKTTLQPQTRTLKVKGQVKEDRKSVV